jgi:endonuclease YncB( thermonuclease family)
MAHDFTKFPELTNAQMEFYYFASPHKQITEDFRAFCTKVVDGDTIHVDWRERNFTFPVRFLNTNAPEMNENGGKESKSWLEKQILGKDIDIEINPSNRVGKFGRILGTVRSGGMDMSEMSVMLGFATPFDNRNEGKIPTAGETLKSGS